MKLLRKIKCPKCGHKKIILREWALVSEAYFIENNEVIDYVGYELNGMPDIINDVIAYCGKCKHEWKLRNVIQITDVIDTE